VFISTSQRRAAIDSKTTGTFTARRIHSRGRIAFKADTIDCSSCTGNRTSHNNGSVFIDISTCSTFSTCGTLRRLLDSLDSHISINSIDRLGSSTINVNSIGINISGKLHVRCLPFDD
jgi:hypothetical protein